MKAKPIFALQLAYQGQTSEFASEDNFVVIGRSKTCGVALHECDLISREHLRIDFRDGQLWVTDLRSTNGSFYRGLQLMANTRTLYTGGAVMLGDEYRGFEINISMPFAPKAEVTIILPTDDAPSYLSTTPADKVVLAEVAPKVDVKALFAPTPPAAPKALSETPSPTPAPLKQETEILSPTPASPLEKTIADDGLLQMQMIEAELQELIQKKQFLGLEVQQLGNQATEFYRQEAEYKENQEKSALALVQAQAAASELKVTKAELEKCESELAFVQDRLATSVKEIKAAHIDLESKEQELKSHAMMVDLKKKELEAQQKSLTSGNQDLLNLSDKIDQLNNDAARKTQSLRNIEKEIAQAEDMREQKEHFVAEVEAKITELIAKQGLQTKTIEELTEKKTGLSQTVTELRAEVNKLQISLDGQKSELKIVENKIELSETHVSELDVKAKKLQAELDSAQKTKSKLTAEIAGYEEQITTLASTAQADSAELKKLKEARAEALIHFQHAQTELEHVQRKMKMEVESLDAESRLRKATIEREVEEIRTRKTQASHEFDSAQNELEKMQTRVIASKSQHDEITRSKANETEKLKELQSELIRLEEQKAHDQQIVNNLLKKFSELDAEIEGVHANAKEEARVIVDNAEQERVRKKFEMETWGIARKNALQSEEEELKASFDKTYADLDKKRIAIEVANITEKEEFLREFEEVKKRSHQEHEATMAAFKDMATEMHNQVSEELRLWKTQEEARVVDIVKKNVNTFAHQVAMMVLADHQAQNSIPYDTILNTLEARLVEGLSGQAQKEGNYNPHLKKLARKFWIQASGVAAGLALAFCGFHYGPELIGQKLAILKVENQAQDQRYMAEVKAERERMLALNLEPKPDFQDHYVDNVLYNPGYLAMKLDPQIQKDWTIKLSKFFFDDLLFDDRKVVEFIPIETALISSLNETYKVLNSRNFEVNLVQMKHAEQDKIEEMWLLVGGRDNWVKLRKKEAEFFAQHNGGAPSTRTPASK